MNINNLKITWTNFKNKIDSKNLNLQYEEYSTNYEVWAIESYVRYFCYITKTDPKNDDQIEFEDIYKSGANKPIIPVSLDGKQFVRAESRPLDCTTIFTGAGDNTVIADGKELIWDFSNDDDLITAPDGYKCKRLDFKFLDSVYVKEGTIYIKDAPKGCYLDFYLVCPTGNYYLDNNGIPRLAEVDTIIAHFVAKHHMHGSVPMGDELNTETCSEEIPNNYKFWIDITTPNTDVVSSGSISLELYRKRTVVLE